MNKINVLILLLSLFEIANAQESITYESQRDPLTQEQSTRSGNESLICDCATPEKIPCLQITESTCKNLWSAKNKGRLVDHGEVISKGDSRISGLSQSKLLDLEALTSSYDGLPKDLKRALRSDLQKLDRLLKKTKIANSDFYFKLSNIEASIKSKAEQVAYDRFYKANPKLKKTNQEDWGDDDVAHRQDMIRTTKDDVLLAKYEKSPQWARVERLFKKTKQDVMHALEELPSNSITAEKRRWMIERVKSIALTLPYMDVEKAGAEGSCQTTNVNAYYNPNRHQFTVCAGWFNSYQTDSIIASVMAHEIGHSIDQNSYATSEVLKSKIVQDLKPLHLGGEMPCEKWNSIVLNSNTPSDIIDRSSFPLSKLNKCVAPQTGLIDFNSAAIRPASQSAIASYVSSIVESGVPTRLAQETIVKYGKESPNKAYLNPKWLEMRENQSMHSPPDTGEWLYKEMFVQSLKCQGFESASREQQSPMIGKALSEMKAISVRVLENRMEIEGRNSSSLVRYNAAVEGGEAFSDWIASRASVTRVKDIESLKERREYIAKSIAWSCPAPSPLASAEDFAREAKKYSLEPHPPDSVRRFSKFSPALAELLNCEMPKDIPSFGGCEP